MVTDIKTIASFIAAAIWVDNEYDETEKTVVSEIADALEFDETELFAAVDAATEEIRGLDEDGVNDYLQKAADAVDDEEIGIVFEAVMQLILADSVITEDEISTLLAMASALGLSDEMAIMLLLDMVKEEPELEVDFGE